MDSSALAKLVGYGASHGFDSILVTRRGRIVEEAYYAPYAADIPHQIQSSTKAVIGTLTGIMLNDGLLDRLDRPMLDFFADRRVANVDDRKKAISVQNLLDMTSGFDWDQGFENGKEQSLIDLDQSANKIQFMLDTPMAHAPGEVFNYSDANPHLLSAIIAKMTGRIAEDYAREKLFSPLGIVDWHWDRDPQGLTIGQWTLTLLPRDMAKIGYLYLRHGEWEGKRLLPLGWADVLSHATVNMHASFDPGLRYSNFFWVFPENHVFMAVGWHGQLIAVFPELDIVAVVTAHRFVPFHDVIDGVFAAVKSESALPPNPNAAEALAAAIQDAAVEKPTAIGSRPETASLVSGKTYVFPDNPLGIKSLALLVADPRPRFAFELASRDLPNSSAAYEIPIGLDGLYSKAITSSGPGHISGYKGTWLNGQTYEIDARDLGYGGERKLLLSFSGEKLNFRYTTEHGREVSVDGEQSD